MNHVMHVKNTLCVIQKHVWFTSIKSIDTIISHSPNKVATDMYVRMKLGVMRSRSLGLILHGYTPVTRNSVEI